MRKIGPKFSQIVSVRLEGGWPPPPPKPGNPAAFSQFFFDGFPKDVETKGAKMCHPSHQSLLITHLLLCKLKLRPMWWIPDKLTGWYKTRYSRNLGVNRVKPETSLFFWFDFHLVGSTECSNPHPQVPSVLDSNRRLRIKNISTIFSLTNINLLAQTFFFSSVRSSSGYHGLIEIRSATHFFRFFKFFRF